MNIKSQISFYYTNIQANKPNFINTNNSYDRYCVYNALEKYAKNCDDIWFNKSYKKHPYYATETICKKCKCIVKEYDVENYESYCGGYTYYWCNNCNMCKPISKVWCKNDFMYNAKQPYKINIYYTKPNFKTRKFTKNI